MIPPLPEVWQRFAGKWATCGSGLAEIDVVGESLSVHCGAQICIMCGKKRR
jgi:hypothetical protein